MARHVAAAVFTDGKFLIVKRAADASHWAGFWELPRVVADEGETLECAAARAARDAVGLEVEVGRGFGTVKHAVTVTKIQLTGFVAAQRDVAEQPRAVQGDDFAWIDFDELSEYAIASPHRKLIGQLQASLDQQSLSL